MSRAFHRDFAATKTLNSGTGPDLTFTRASNATYFDSSGVLQLESSNDVARFDHDPSDNTSLGLRMEVARTNLCLQSEDFTTTWINTNTDEPSTNNTAPDGNATADEIAATSTADQQFAIYQSFTGLTAATDTVVSVFGKVGTNATRIQLAFDSNGSGADGFFANFDLSGGTAGSATAMTAGTALQSGIQDVGSGWYRCFVSGQIASGTVGRFTIGIIDNASAVKFEAANLTDNDSVILWGAEVNQASIAEVPTSYIPTTTASVTRAKDVCSHVTQDVDLTFYNPDTSTIYVKYYREVLGTGQFDYLYQFADESGTADRPEVKLFLRNSGDTVYSYITPLSGSSSLVGINNKQNVAAFNNHVVAYDSSGAQRAINGFVPALDSPLTVGEAGTDEFHIGNLNGANQLNGCIAIISYYDTRLSDAQLTTLSNGLSLGGDLLPFTKVRQIKMGIR